MTGGPGQVPQSLIAAWLKALTSDSEMELKAATGWHSDEHALMSVTTVQSLSVVQESDWALAIACWL